MTRLHELAEKGQAVWFDFIRRRFIESGELKKLIDDGVRGVTSNPSIFEKAIAGSSDYDGQIGRLAKEGLEVEEIYEALAVEDIMAAAHLLRCVYDETSREDGYVSLEVSPRLANNKEATVSEALRLFKLINQPNVMIKVPATPEGVAAIEELIAHGVNINATLIFSVEAYKAVANAYINGLEKLLAKGGDPASVASVASIFVSRIDSAVDPLLLSAGKNEMVGRIAVDNSKLAYASFKKLFSGPRWKKLAGAGARVQRPLWASTGTKNPAFPDTLYVDTLIGPHTVNTVPPATLTAFMDHGAVASTIEEDLSGAKERLKALKGLGIDLAGIMDVLLRDGLKSFSDAFDTLLASVAAKRAVLAGRNPLLTFGPLSGAVKAKVAHMEGKRVAMRLWEKDHTLWSKSPEEISNRLGWLDVAGKFTAELEKAASLRKVFQKAGMDRVLLIGMGGSSLAPEVFAKSFPEAAGLMLGVADTTVPEGIAGLAKDYPPAKTLYVVSTKSGGTVETLSLFKYFHQQAVDALGEGAGGHFVLITDPCSALEKIGADIKAAHVFLNDPDIGGRYAALSLVGLVPAALIGVDTAKVVASAQKAMAASKNPTADAACLGSALGALSDAGIDKLTLLCSERIKSFGDWVEQLVAESTGKMGRGILPVVGEPLLPPQSYSPDRFFVAMILKGDTTMDAGLAALEGAGFPVVRYTLDNPYDLGYHFFSWAFATAVAGWSLGVPPFNQPDVESAKALARAMLADHKASGKIKVGEPGWKTDEVLVFGAPEGASPAKALRALVNGAKGNGYLAVQAYLARGEGVDAGLKALREGVLKISKLPVTIGYGPRFLHSTGQLHKGDKGLGVFLQITSEDAMDLAIPDDFDSPASSAGFGAVKLSQVLGDAGALKKAGRPVVRLHLKTKDIEGFLKRLAAEL